jgi:hypothetical protein
MSTDRLTVGVAVPGYIKHIQYIYDLLDSYEAGTEKPDKLVISLSSMPEGDFKLEKTYSYPIEIFSTTKMQTPSKNRNVAKAHLDTDIISFMDIDDKAHPNRIEYIRRAFIENPEIDALVHNFTRRVFFNDPIEPQPYTYISNAIYVSDLVRAKKECMPPLPPSKHEQGIVMHSQPSLKKSVARRFDFDEAPSAMYKEDLFYLRALLGNEIKFGYLNSRLSHYRPLTR